MSKVFYDHLIDLSKLELIISRNATSVEEKAELWAIVDEIVHHKVMGCIFDNLERQYHEEFIDKFVKAPFDDQILTFLEKKAGKNLTEKIKFTVSEIDKEITGNVMKK